MHRILIVRTDDRVGNALLTIPLARALVQSLPAAEIDLLLSASQASVARDLPGIRLIEFHKRDSFRHPIRFLRFLLALRQRGYDAVIDAAHWHAFSLTSALLSRWASSGRVIGSNRGPTALYTDLVALPETDLLEVEAKLQLAAPLLSLLATPRLETSLGQSREAQQAARATRRELGISGAFAAFNPGARKNDHRWDTQKFAALAKSLRARHGLPSLIFWGPGEESLAREVCEQSAGVGVLAPPTDLDALAAHFRACAIAVTNDTGPMHLAVACGAPTLAIFLAPGGARWGHSGPHFAAVAGASAGGDVEQADLALALDLRDAEEAAGKLLALTEEGAGESFPAQHSLAEEVS